MDKTNHLPPQSLYDDLQGRLGYTFKEPALMREALTHASRTNECPSEPCYERLEYLGDAVIELLVTNWLFLRYPTWGEGRMTKARASVVSEPALANLARELGLGQCLRMGRGAQRLGARENPSILCDVFEALVGAIYLEGGVEDAQRVVLPLLDESLSKVHNAQAVLGDYKTVLQELLQAKGERHICYRLTGQDGPPHERVFTVALEVDGQELARGSGRSKKAAQQEAARQALGTLGGETDEA